MFFRWVCVFLGAYFVSLGASPWQESQRICGGIPFRFEMPTVPRRAGHCFSSESDGSLFLLRVSPPRTVAQGALPTVQDIPIHVQRLIVMKGYKLSLSYHDDRRNLHVIYENPASDKLFFVSAFFEKGRIFALATETDDMRLHNRFISSFSFLSAPAVRGSLKEEPPPSSSPAKKSCCSCCAKKGSRCGG